MKRELPRTYARAATLMARGRVHLAKAREALLTAHEIFEELCREERSDGTKETTTQPESSSEEREAAARTFAEDDAPQGEWVLIPERIVVSPGLGRFHPVAFKEGQQIKKGVSLVDIRENGRVDPVVARVGGTFLAWMVSEGKRVHAGEPLARLGRFPNPREEGEARA
jgi:biotin carboxyl carrier protein